MKVVSLQSGSNGNCYYVEAAGARLLVDAGISGKRARQRLEALGRDIREIDALLLTHDHGDHSRSAGVFHRMFSLPLWATRGTASAVRARRGIGKLSGIREFRAGEVVDFGRARVRTIPTPHDGVEGVALVIEAEGRRLGILTDLGHVFDGLPETLAELDAVFLESNYDPEMLAAGPYPPMLQERIRGHGGHLSNAEAAELLCEAGDRLRWACLSHLSENCNCPEAAMETHRTMAPARLRLLTASRYEAGEVLEL